MSIAENGKITGSYWGDEKGKLSGSVSGSGKLDMKSGGGSAGSGKWSGAITVDSDRKLHGKGTWNVEGYEGTWSGEGTGEMQGISSPVKITTSTSFESDVSAGSIKNIVRTKATLSFWNVGNKVSGYGKAMMDVKSVSSLNGSSQEMHYAGTFSGGPNGIMHLSDDRMNITLKVINGKSVKVEGQSVSFSIPDPSVFKY